jgi:hypothetical protein
LPDRLQITKQLTQLNAGDISAEVTRIKNEAQNKFYHLKEGQEMIKVFY